jgi:hypothetical protein
MPSLRFWVCWLLATCAANGCGRAESDGEATVAEGALAGTQSVGGSIPQGGASTAGGTVASGGRSSGGAESGGLAPGAGGASGRPSTTMLGTGGLCSGTTIDSMEYRGVSLDEFCDVFDCPGTIREAETLDPRCEGQDYFAQYRRVGCNTTIIGLVETVEQLGWYFDTNGNSIGRLVGALYADDVGTSPGACQGGDVIAGRTSLCEDTVVCTLCGDVAGVPRCD